jgi:hypothetical protein
LVLRVNLQAAAFDAAQIDTLRPMVGDHEGRIRDGFRVKTKHPNKKDGGEKKQDDKRRRNFGHDPALRALSKSARLQCHRFMTDECQRAGQPQFAVIAIFPNRAAGQNAQAVGVPAAPDQGWTTGRWTAGRTVSAP